MFKSKKILFSMVILIIVISACNLPGGQPPISNATPDLVLTITAQALLLQTPLNSQPPPESTLTPAVPGQVIGTDTPAFTATTTLTPTSSIPMLTVSADTNCRSGPNKDYAYLGVLLINETAEIVGKNTVTNYWIIKNPDAVGTCWLWGNYATVSGDTSKLAEVFAVAGRHKIPALLLGKTASGNLKITINDVQVIDVAVDKLYDTWDRALEESLHV